MSDSPVRCSRCHRVLKDPESIRLGIGPECRNRSHNGQRAHFSSGDDFTFMKKTSEIKLRRVIKRYERGASGVKLAQSLGMTVQNLYALMRRRGVKIRTVAEVGMLRRLPAKYCASCGSEIPNRKDRKGDLCISCARNNRCPECGQMLPINGEHVCNGVDLRGDRFCEDCGKPLDKQDRYERWHNTCTTCGSRRGKIQERQERSRLKQAFGGRCNRCGYDRCEWALHFHHKDSRFKYEFRKSGGTSLREIKLHPERFELLCANCHYEEHAFEISSYELDRYSLSDKEQS